MAIQKRKLVEETRALRTKIDIIENEIDAQLRINFGEYYKQHGKYPDETNTTGAAVGPCGGRFTEKEIQEILRRYREAGWQIWFNVDQRDGAFFILQ